MVFLRMGKGLLRSGEGKERLLPMLHLCRKHSRLLLVAAMFLGWTCLYAGLRMTRTPEPAEKSRSGTGRRIPASETLPDFANGSDAEDALEVSCKVFHFPELTMRGLAVVLGDWGLRLDYPASARSLTLQGNRLGGRARAAILMDLLRPHALGFYRREDMIRVLPVDWKQTRKDRGESPGALKSSRLRAELKIKAGEPVDFWVESDPLICLRIGTQPLYGEMNAETEVSIMLEGRRDAQPWFQQGLEVLPGQTASFEIKGMQAVWCLITPKKIEGQIVTLEVDFYHESNVAND